MLIKNKSGNTNSEYFNNLQRSGLKVPTHFVKSIIYHMCAIFEKNINNSIIECAYLQTSSQKTILCYLNALNNTSFQVNFFL